jgi:hypothetical protein
MRDIALVLAFGMFGCAASVDDAGALGADEAAATASSTGQYSVPVSDPRLESQATHPVTVKVQERAGIVRVHYDLPEQLVGSPLVGVDLEGVRTASGTLTLTGPMGTGTCQVTASVVHCDERFTDVSVNLEGVKQTAINEGLSAVETAKRVEVARIFAMDPIGILQSNRGPGSASSGGGRKGRDR